MNRVHDGAGSAQVKGHRKTVTLPAAHEHKVTSEEHSRVRAFLENRLLSQHPPLDGEGGKAGVSGRNQSIEGTFEEASSPPAPGRGNTLKRHSGNKWLRVNKVPLPPWVINVLYAAAILDPAEKKK